MPIRILLAKPGLDVHDRGIRVLAYACRDAGMEVILLRTGLVTVDQAVAAAVQEDVDIVGLSIMTGEPERICQDALTALEEQNARDIPLVVGGVIRKEKIPALETLGVAGVFMPGASLDHIITQIRDIVGKQAETRQRVRGGAG